MNTLAATAATPHDTAPSAQPLLRQARLLLWWTLLPLLAMVVLLAAWQTWTQWQRLLEGAATELRLQRLAFETIARDASQHVADLQRTVQDDFLRGEGRADPALQAALQPRHNRSGAADGWTLDGLAPLLRGSVGQLLWIEQAGGAAPSPAVLRRTQSLSSVIEIAHQRNPDLVWSYAFGWPDRHMVLFPWVRSADVAEGQGATDLKQALTGWFDYEVFTAGRPENNPTQQAYWTAPYVDAGGQGLLVSHAAPVMVAETLRGVVGTDIRLSALETLLQRVPGDPWEAWVIDRRGHVLADRQRPVSGAAAAASASAAASAAASTPAAPPLLAQRLPAGLDQATLDRALAARGQALDIGGRRVIAMEVTGAPWTLVLAAPNAALLAVLRPQVLPYLLIATGLLLVWVLGQALLTTRLVRPMVAVIDYQQRLSMDPSAPPPVVDERWQPWIAMVAGIFERLRSAAQGERRAQALKSAIVDHAQNAVVVADGEDRIVEFNPAAEAMFGWQREQVLGRTVREVIAPERLHDAYGRASDRLREGDQDELMGKRLERVAVRADGSEFPVEVVMWRTIVDDAAFFTASLSDLTTAKASAAVIERQRDALRQSEKLTAMGSLLAGVAHELNNPLAIVVGRSSLLEEKAAGTAMASDALRIREAAERCGRIVRTFLNMARHKPAQRTAVPLNDLARAAAEMLGYTLRSHAIEVDLRLDPALPLVQADADQLGQVVLNLIVNAQQALATRAPPRRLLLRSGHDDTSAWLCVQDNGPGVPDELREKIFDPFFTTKGEGRGTGLGLSVSRAILDEHGGALVLEASEAGAGSGSSFCLRLPLPAPAPAPAVAEESSP